MLLHYCIALLLLLRVWVASNLLLLWIALLETSLYVTDFPQLFPRGEIEW